MRGLSETKEIEKVDEVKEKSGGVAAFFDLDGTLMTLPSLERRFYRMLRYRGEIGPQNYLCWLREAARLLTRGIRVMVQANKMYLRGVQSFGGCGGGDGENRPRRDIGPQAKRHGVVSGGSDPRTPVPAFFTQALERMEWHAKAGQAIVLVSGTLEPLAEEAARGLETELAGRGLTARIRVCATRLEEKNGMWTGKILGEAMFGEAKARAARRLAGEMQLDLGQCFAYGDSISDKWLLSAVGRAFAVNPSRELERIATRLNWRVLRWGGNKKSVPRAQRSHRGTGALRHAVYDAKKEHKEDQLNPGDRRESLTKAGSMAEATSRSLG